MAKISSHPVQYLTIESAFLNQRIDNFLITKLKGVPKTRIYRMIRKGEVRVNKKRIDPSYRLNTGDLVRIPPLQLNESPPTNPSISLIKLLSSRVLYEDHQLLIINKPAGIPVHGGSQVKVGIIEAIRPMYPKFPHLELAHRLDRDTSGCLILAKKRSILKALHDLLRNGKIQKKYLALTYGHWKEKELNVDVPLKKNQLMSGERIVRVNKEEGKPSLTVFRVLNIYKDSTFVEAHLHTGRTHQIRVHSQYRGHPIAGDEKYGNKDFNKMMKNHGLKRLFLHAHSVEFLLPESEKAIKVMAPLDHDLSNCLDKISML